MAQRTGLEPATPGVTGRYSNRLNYRCASAGLASESQSLPCVALGYHPVRRAIYASTRTKSTARPIFYSKQRPFAVTAGIHSGSGTFFRKNSQLHRHVQVVGVVHRFHPRSRSIASGARAPFQRQCTFVPGDLARVVTIRFTERPAWLSQRYCTRQTGMRR